MLLYMIERECKGKLSYMLKRVHVQFVTDLELKD